MTAALVLLSCVALPAVLAGAVRAQADDAPAAGVVATCGLSCGVSTWLLVAAVLESTVGVTAASTAVAAGAVGTASVAGLVVLGTRDRLRGKGGGDLGVWLGAVGLLAIVTWWPVGRLVMETSWSPLGSTPWYYWGLAAEVASVGHLPAQVAEWGVSVEFLADYRLFSAGSAMLLAVGPDVPALQAVTVLCVLVLGTAAALLASALGAGSLASLLATPLAVGTGIGVLRLTAYRPEALGLGLALLLVASGLWWFRRGDRVALVAAAVLAAVLGQVHAIALVTAAVLLCAAAVSYRVAGAATALRRLLAAGLALGTAWLLLGLVMGGASGAGHTGNLPDTGGIADPTWEFMRAIKGLPSSAPPTSLEVAASALQGGYRGTGVLVMLLLGLVLVALVVTAALPLSDPTNATAQDDVRLARSVIGFLALSVLGLGLVASVFAFGWEGYVPRRTGAQRLALEGTLLVGPGVAAAVSVIAGRWTRSRSAARTLVLGSLAVVTALGLTTSAYLSEPLARQRPDRETLAALSSLDLPRGSVVLTNAYTEGFLARVTGASGLLEGRAPYTYPELLDRANTLLRGGQEYFASPRRSFEFLEEHGVDYLVVTDRRSFALGTSNVFRTPVRRPALATDPRLRLVLRTDDVAVFEVLEPPA